jgi:hypothetical protein
VDKPRPTALGKIEHHDRQPKDARIASTTITEYQLHHLNCSMALCSPTVACVVPELLIANRTAYSPLAPLGKDVHAVSPRNR